MKNEKRKAERTIDVPNRPADQASAGINGNDAEQGESPTSTAGITGSLPAPAERERRMKLLRLSGAISGGLSPFGFGTVRQPTFLSTYNRRTLH